MKNNNSSQVLEIVNDNENKTEKDIHKENCLSNTISFDSNYIEDNRSTPKVTKEKEKKKINKL